jgi:glyoxylase-like metal-dependent hydrolase (beta-lactamase superfamily II)
MESWKIGSVRVTRVVDVVMDVDPKVFLPDATPENLAPLTGWLKPHFVRDDWTIPMSIHAFLVESNGAKIVVDTCIGNDKQRPIPEWSGRKGPFLEDLAARGAPREAVDFVLCTHLHVDHVGFNTVLEGGRWVPTFPNARYLIGREEWAFWKTETDPYGPEAKGDSVVPVLEAGLADLVESAHEITPEVRLFPTPGHTPGHVSVLIESRGERAVITGDLFHHPCQIAHPTWVDAADVDTQKAARTRDAFLRRFSEGTLVLGTHFASPTGGRIVEDGAAYRFDAGA